MTTRKLPPQPAPGKRAILTSTFLQKLGGVSASTLWRMRRTDARFPKPGRIRGQNAWDEDVADAYVALLTGGYTDRAEAAAETNGASSRHVDEPERDLDSGRVGDGAPTPSHDLNPPQRGRPKRSKNKPKVAASSKAA
jgi:predicted DNA-binding transcriptional regulator AlpA